MSNDKIYEILKTHFPSAKLVAGGKEILVRCFFCPDSNNPEHAHMYISNDNLLRYHCKKCGSSGLLTKHKLLELGVVDYNLLKLINNQNSYIINNKNITKSYLKTFNSFNDKDLSLSKLDYINSRLKLNLNFNDIYNNKIIINLNDFMYNNNINNKSNKINDNFIGFLSYDNTCINMRDINNTSKYRYFNFNIYKNLQYESNGRFYLIPTDIDILRKTNVHISEGPFDILSIKYNLQHRLDQNNIFISCGGISYKYIIKFILTDLGIINPSFNIYIDNDTKKYIINDIIQLLNNINCELYIHNNSYKNEKDFGVEKDKILLNTIKIR